MNIASVAGLQGGPPDVMNTVVYNASKGGVIAFTRDLACKWAQARDPGQLDRTGLVPRTCPATCSNDTKNGLK